jgi:hypothetical protein
MMNITLGFAGMLTALLGIVHSIGGELRTFPFLQDLRDQAGKPLISDWSIRVLRGTWHTLSLFGLGLTLVLFSMGFPAFGKMLGPVAAIGISTFVVGLYWAYITRFWHPACILFFVVSLLCWVS